MKRLIVVLALVSSLPVRAEKPTATGGRLHDVGRPNTEIEELYFSLSDLSLEDQRDQMWALSSDIKAALWRYNLERYLRDHRGLSVEAQNALREGIRLVTTPAWFDITEGSFGYASKSLAREEYKSRVSNLLPQEAIFELFIRLGPDPAGVAVDDQNSQKPQGPIPQTNDWSFKCSCASYFDCGSNANYDCFPSWCISNVHCGWFGDELCIGKCKMTGV